MDIFFLNNVDFMCFLCLKYHFLEQECWEIPFFLFLNFPKYSFKLFAGVLLGTAIYKNGF